MWYQVYDPLNNWLLSTLLAALPTGILLGALAFGRIKAHWSAALGLVAALAVAIVAFGMPAQKAASAALFGAVYWLFPIGCIILNVIFLYTFTSEKGDFATLQGSLTRITHDSRLQLLLIAFCFGAFFEGAAGFGTLVAVTAAILIGLGFLPLTASGLSLIANTVALTGSDTSSDVMFGSLPRVTAEQLGISPVLMAAANSSGGVMGKMIDAQSIVVASTATRWYGQEGEILRYVIFHSIALAALVGILVFLQAYVFPQWSKTHYRKRCHSERVCP
jgi:L-lactate permease